MAFVIQSISMEINLEYLYLEKKIDLVDKAVLKLKRSFNAKWIC